MKPIFEHDSIVWGYKRNSVQMDFLQILQNRAAKTILGRDPFSSATQALKDLSWMTLAKKRTMARCIFVYKCLNNLILILVFIHYRKSILIIQHIRTILVFRALKPIGVCLQQFPTVLKIGIL